MSVLPECIYVHYTYVHAWYRWRPVERARYPGTGVTNLRSYLVGPGSWYPNSGTLQYALRHLSNHLTLFHNYLLKRFLFICCLVIF